MEILGCRDIKLEGNNITDFERGNTLAGREIPYLDGLISRAGRDPAVARPRDRPDRDAMAPKRDGTLASRGIPDLDGLVMRAGRDPAVSRPCDR